MIMSLYDSIMNGLTEVIANTKLYSVKCPKCGKKNIEVYSSIDDNIKYIRCKDCDKVYFIWFDKNKKKWNIMKEPEVWYEARNNPYFYFD